MTLWRGSRLNWWTGNTISEVAPWSTLAFSPRLFVLAISEVVVNRERWVEFDRGADAPGSVVGVGGKAVPLCSVETGWK